MQLKWPSLLAGRNEMVRYNSVSTIRGIMANISSSNGPLSYPGSTALASSQWGEAAGQTWCQCRGQPVGTNYSTRMSSHSLVVLSIAGMEQLQLFSFREKSPFAIAFINLIRWRRKTGPHIMPSKIESPKSPAGPISQHNCCKCIITWHGMATHEFHREIQRQAPERHMWKESNHIANTTVDNMWADEMDKMYANLCFVWSVKEFSSFA